jgi:metal-responsive CopG/Arc/MetJ family transcriptional regulator
MADRTLRTTLALPAELIAAADRAVRAGKARSRNELVSIALRRELQAMERAAIDAEFAGMATDASYQDEAETIMREFAQADREALDAGECAYAGDDRATR